MGLEIIKSSESGSSPHLALTHNELQNGAANKRNVSLLLKAEDLDEETIALLKKAVGEDIDISQTIQKASYKELRNKLSDAVKKFENDRWSYSYVENFDESNVVFYTDGGLHYTTYSLQSDGTVTLGDIAYPANEVITYESATGALLMTEGNGNIPDSVRTVIMKSIDSLSSKAELVEVFKSIHKEEETKNMELQELQKSLTDAQSLLQKATADLEKANAEKAELQGKLDEINKAVEDKKQADRLEEIKKSVTDEAQAVALQKSLESLSDEAFENVLKTFTAKDQKLEQSDLFTEVNKSAKADTHAEGLTAQLLAKQFGPANKTQ